MRTFVAMTATRMSTLCSWKSGGCERHTRQTVFFPAWTPLVSFAKVHHFLEVNDGDVLDLDLEAAALVVRGGIFFAFASDVVGCQGSDEGVDFP